MAQTSCLSILLVDGERVAREALARQFSDAGWSVTTAASRAQALASADVPDCLVVDRDLVDGSGFNLFERLRVANPGLCAVMMTRHPSVTEAVRAIHAGFRDYRLKSLDFSDLLASAAWQFGRGARPSKDPAKTTSSLARVEWNHIQEVLMHSRGNVSEAARVLGLHRRSLQRKLRRSAGDAMIAAREAREE